MEKNHFKSILGLLLMSFFLSVMLPAEADAQRYSRKEKEAYAHRSPPEKKKPVATPVRHYDKHPRRGAHVTVLPPKALKLKHRSFDYYYDDGIFYRPVNGTFVVTAPPIGIRVSVLPRNPYRVVYAGRDYYYYYGSYYLPLPHGGYEVVPPPLGARIDALPDGYEVFELDQKIYYRLGETYYKAILEPNGNVVYEVVRV